MNIRSVIPMFFGLAMLTGSGCSPPTENNGIESLELQGQVVNRANGNPISNAVVRVIDPPPPPQHSAITDEDGRFSMVIDVDSTMDLTITASIEGFSTDTMQILATPDRELIDLQQPFRLTATEDGFEESDEGAGSIRLISVTPENIFVNGTGGPENAEFEFEVQDSSGRPLGLSNAVDVTFRFGSHPDGGEYLHPASVKTDGQGRVAVNLNSGTKAGTVQIIAEVDGTAINSRPVRITIHSGLPDQDHFAIISENLNIPGFHIFGGSTFITALVGDKYGNIVSPGTSVYFTTDGGFIEGSAETDERGRAVVELTASNPRPPNGVATITAQTADENNATIETQTTVTFSGSPEITINPDFVNLINMEGQIYDYTVQDENGNPLAAGTQITVTAETPDDDLALLGDVEITLDDYQISGEGTTEFKFTIADDDDTVLEREVQITVNVDGPNGVARKTITGTKMKVAP
ncbi:MAG: invasin domain 3-containing protein [Balneolales bacterium]